MPYTHSYVTVTKSQVLTLHLKDWEDLLKHFPKSRNSIYKNIVTDDDNPDGDDEPGSKGLVKRDDEPPSSSQKEPSTFLSSPASSQEFGSLRKNRSNTFVPPPGTSQTLTRSETIDRPYIWPTRSKISTSSLDSVSITKQPSRNPSMEHLRALDDDNTNKLPEKADVLNQTKSNMSVRNELSSESIKPTTSKRAMLNENIWERSISSESFKEKQKRKEDLKKLKEQPIRTRPKSPSEVKSVEDYIQEQYRNDQDWHENKSSQKLTMEQFKGISPLISLKKRKPRVRYQERKSSTLPVEFHELKPIRDLSTDERNLRSLDSDMPAIQKVKEIVSKPKVEENELADSSSETNSSIESDKEFKPKSKK